MKHSLPRQSADVCHPPGHVHLMSGSRMNNLWVLWYHTHNSAPGLLLIKGFLCHYFLLFQTSLRGDILSLGLSVYGISIPSHMAAPPATQFLTLRPISGLQLDMILWSRTSKTAQVSYQVFPDYSWIIAKIHLNLATDSLSPRFKFYTIPSVPIVVSGWVESDI